MPPRKKQTTDPFIQPVSEPVLEPVTEMENFSEESAENDETFTFKRSHFYAFMTVLAFAAGVLLGYVAWGMEPAAGAASQTSAAVAQAPAQEQQFRRYEIPIENSYALGPADAPITIVEFSDYQCPYCRRWHDQVYEPLLAAYPGKIKFVYRHLPLDSIHPDAIPAAEAAMCAGEQDAFWQFHEKLFSSEALGSQVYTQYAQDLRLNMKTFESCVSDRKYQQAVATDANFAINLGIRSTPTFFINGLAVVGAQPLDVFKQVIDKELAGEIPN
jgi:protein-disulfide isomerase